MIQIEVFSPFIITFYLLPLKSRNIGHIFIPKFTNATNPLTTYPFYTHGAGGNSSKRIYPVIIKAKKMVKNRGLPTGTKQGGF